jgi:hypothetical protein
MESHKLDEFLVGDWRIHPAHDQNIRGDDTVRLEQG